MPVSKGKARERAAAHCSSSSWCLLLESSGEDQAPALRKVFTLVSLKKHPETRYCGHFFLRLESG